MIFNKAPIKTEYMAMAGRPCALIKEFSPVEISTKQFPANKWKGNRPHSPMYVPKRL